MSTDELPKILDEVTLRLREAMDPVAIFLYGSWAYGKPTEDSDLDLLIVIETSNQSFIDRSAEAYRVLRGIGVAIDVQVYTREEFDERAKLPVSFERTVKDKGRVLYAA